MGKKKIFISGPMTGYPSWNYPKFDMIEEMLRSWGYDSVNPANIGKKFGPEKVDSDPELYKKMEAEIQAAERTCDVIFLLRGWEESKGVRLELKTALELNLPILVEGDRSIERLYKGDF